MPTMPYRPPLAGTPWDSVYDPKQASIFDSTLEKVVRTLATITGANDPTQIPAALTAVTPAGQATGGLAKVIDDLVKRRQAIKAYHGSPHDFDQFSMDKIGTGEGAQAYGHGLYFAENKGTAEYYKDALSRQAADPRNDVNSIVYNWLSVPGGPSKPMTPEIAASVMKDFDTLRPLAGDRQIATDIARFVNGHRELGGTVNADGFSALRVLDKRLPTPPPGRMYEVAIKASPDDFLDWDKPLSQQSEKVRQAILSEVDERVPAFSNTYRRAGVPEPRIAEIVSKTRAGALDGTPESYIKDFGQETPVLAKHGVPGVKYLDGGSRATGDGTRNYVVWKPEIIEILRKWGLLPFAAGVGAQQQQTSEAK